MYILFQKAQNKILRNFDKIPFLQNRSQLAYLAAVEKHQINLPVLSKYDQSLVDKINSQGVAITSLEALGIPSSQKMFSAAKDLMPKIPKRNSQDETEFVVHATSQQMMQFSDIFLWGLEHRLLKIVENYLGLPVAYHGAYFRRDIANQIQIKSRLWHIDSEDRKVLKVILYLNDVKNDVGPFEYIPQSLTSKAVDSLKYYSGYIRDEIMQQFVSPSNWKSCIGTAGTVVFAGTGSIFHRGKIPIVSDRFAIFFDYTSRQPKQPFYGTLPLEKDDLLLLAKNFSEYQRKCVFG